MEGREIVNDFRQDGINTRDTLELALKGGGGTDFRPVFDLVEHQGVTPSCLVYLTDLQCSRFPEIPPDYPVLWVNTDPGFGTASPPFGRIIDME